MTHQQKLETGSKKKGTGTVAAHNAGHLVESLEKTNWAVHMFHMVYNHNLDGTCKSSYPHKHPDIRSNK